MCWARCWDCRLVAPSWPGPDHRSDERHSSAAFAGNPGEIEPRLGYRVKVAPLVLELKKRVALLDQQMDDLAAAARRAGVAIDQR